MLELNTPTEPSVDNLPEDEKLSGILNLSKKGLKKVPKQNDAQHVKELILDENSLQKIDNIDSFLKIEKVSKVIFNSYGSVSSLIIKIFYFFCIRFQYKKIIYFECMV